MAAMKHIYLKWTQPSSEVIYCWPPTNWFQSSTLLIATKIWCKDGHKISLHDPSLGPLKETSEATVKWFRISHAQSVTNGGFYKSLSLSGWTWKQSTSSRPTLSSFPPDWIQLTDKSKLSTTQLCSLESVFTKAIVHHSSLARGSFIDYCPSSRLLLFQIKFLQTL